MLIVTRRFLPTDKFRFINDTSTAQAMLLIPHINTVHPLISRYAVEMVKKSTTILHFLVPVE